MRKVRPVRIIVDSSCDAAPEVRARLRVVPLRVRFGNDEYIDGVTITHREFYYMLTQRQDLPTTSQANPAAFARVYDEVLAADEDAVVLTISSALSKRRRAIFFSAGPSSSIEWRILCRTDSISYLIMEIIFIYYSRFSLFCQLLRKKPQNFIENRNQIC